MSSLVSKQGVLAVLEHALQQPQLQYSDIQSFRHRLATGLNCYSTALNALFIGAQAATPGMAFLAGYQNAVRCLDANCPNDELAAFCVSEKGVKKPWDMASRISASKDSYRLSGQKGYVMLLPGELDRMYVIAKNEDDQLACLYLPVMSSGVSVTDPLKAPFVEDIPHTGVSFDSVHIPSEQLLKIDGHYQANKPFRYWEDIHVGLSLMAWMLREQVENGKKLTELEDLVRLICQLVENFEKYPDYYSADSFSLLDESHELMEKHSQNLSEVAQKMWKKDRLIVQMGQKIRHLVHAKLSL